MEHRVEIEPSRARSSSIPGSSSIQSFLKACEEQTARFDWLKLLDAVAAKLGMLPGQWQDPLTPSVFKGLTLLLPYVQTLPEDRELIVQSRNSVPFLVVWMHHVLGFDVLVKKYRDMPDLSIDLKYDVEEVLFGRSLSTILIDCTLNQHDGTVTLIESSSQDTLFSIVPEQAEDMAITSLVKRPARGFAMEVLESEWVNCGFFWTRDRAPKACLREMVLVCISLAIRLAKHLYKDTQALRKGPPGFHSSTNLERTRSALEMDSYGDNDVNTSETYRYDIPETKILQAAELLFDQKSLSSREISHYVAVQGNMPTNDIPSPPTIDAAVDHLRSGVMVWPKTLLPAVSDLAVLILAFSHITNLKDVSGFLMNIRFIAIQRSLESVARVALEWKGNEPIRVPSHVWFSFLVSLMTNTSELETLDFDKLSLASSHGWTVYLPCFGNPDPEDVGKSVSRSVKSHFS
jgi:hypothetical protein